VKVRVAVVQATPVVLDGLASVEKACGLIGEAAANGARLVALPEAFIPLKPQSCWGHHLGVVESAKAAALYRRLWDNAVEIGGPLALALGDAARQADAWVSIGVNERDVRRPGTLWNSLLLLAPDGRLAGCHRKLVPTAHERTFWGQGPGDDLTAVQADFGRLGGLICWENFMPDARRRLHQEGVDFYLAPTADDRDLWTAAMRTFSFEAGAFVLSSIQYLRGVDFPEDFPLRDELSECPAVHLAGGSLICDPWGNVLA
jgi:nitrilase